MEKIRWEVAKRIREKGLILDPTKDYVNPRIKEIAQRQFELNKEFEELDKELFAFDWL